MTGWAGPAAYDDPISLAIGALMRVDVMSGVEVTEFEFEWCYHKAFPGTGLEQENLWRFHITIEAAMGSWERTG